MDTKHEPGLSNPSIRGFPNFAGVQAIGQFRDRSVGVIS